MGVLDQITKMKKEGMSENEIISQLQQKGIAPKDINEALNQSNIKSAVSSDYNSPEEKSMSDQPYDSYSEEDQPENYENSYDSPQNNQNYTSPPMQSYSNEYYPEQPSNYSGYSENDVYGGGTDTFIEIAEQVISEKMKDIKKQIETLNEFKSLTSIKLDNTIERLKKIENSMDKLQMAILDKVGSYGNTLESIKKEMNMMQDSFGKVLPSMAEKHHKTSHITPSTKKATKKKTTKKHTSKK